MKLIFSLLIYSICLSFSAPIKVRVIGISDGHADGLQKDRNEAMLDAKRNAIEKAGVAIQSKTTVENFMVSSDKIETLAEAVLLPGYEIIDVGYDEQEVAYKVVLIGEVRSVNEEKSIHILYRTKQGCRQDFRIFQKNKILSESLTCDVEHPINLESFENIVVLSPAQSNLSSKWLQVATPQKEEIKKNKLVVKGVEIESVKANYTNAGESEFAEGSALVKSYEHQDTLNYFDGIKVITLVPSTKITMKGKVTNGEFVCESSTRSFNLNGKELKSDHFEAPCQWPQRGEFKYEGVLEDGSELKLRTRRNHNDWYWAYELINPTIAELYRARDFVE